MGNVKVERSKIDSKCLLDDEVGLEDDHKAGRQGKSESIDQRVIAQPRTHTASCASRKIARIESDSVHASNSQQRTRSLVYNDGVQKTPLETARISTPRLTHHVKHERNEAMVTGERLKQRVYEDVLTEMSAQRLAIEKVERDHEKVPEHNKSEGRSCDCTGDKHTPVTVRPTN